METSDTSRPARPLVWLAGTLGAGTHLGLTASEGAGLAASAAVLGLALAAFHLVRRGSAPAWTALVLVLAFARACLVDAPPPAGPALTSVEARELRIRPIAGRWHGERDGRTGWVEPFQADRSDAPRRAHALLFEPECTPPADGTPIAILPGSEVVPWPRGPVPSPRARARTFAALAPVAPDELVRLAPPSSASRLSASLLEELHALRAAVGARVARVECGSSTGLLRALVIGARDGMAQERIDLFARTGTSHLLAISGWHVGLFAALVVLPLARITRRSLAWTLARALLLTLFAAIAGAEKPVLRATLALVLLQLAVLRARPERLRENPAPPTSAPPRRPDGLSFLAAAFALECLFDPAGIRMLSLSLSYAATLGLILGTGAIGRGLRPAPEPWTELAPARWVRVLAGRLRAWLTSGLAASAAAVLATLPLTWSTFGEFAPAGVVLTLLALPPFTFLSLLAWLAALVPWSGLALPAELGARALYGLLELGDALPGTPLLLPPRPAGLLLAATALAFLGLERAWARRAAALVWGILLLPWSATPRGLELHLLDAGHGSAAVLRAPGIEALVFDAGSRDRRALASEALLPLLARWEVARASVVLSHPDHDHASGLPRLSERLRIDRWLGAEPAQGPVRLPHDAPRLDLAQGRLTLGSPCTALSLALLRGSARDGNEGSRALEIVWRSERVVLLGDAEAEGLEGLALEAGPLRLLLAPHHGSDAPALGSLLDRCPPAQVWISSSEDPSISGELERRGIEWRWTGREGPLALRLP